MQKQSAHKVKSSVTVRHARSSSLTASCHPTQPCLPPCSSPADVSDYSLIRFLHSCSGKLHTRQAVPVQAAAVHPYAPSCSEASCARAVYAGKPSQPARLAVAPASTWGAQVHGTGAWVSKQPV